MSQTEIYPKAEFIRKPNVPKCGLNTRHDNREVTLIHLARAQILRFDKCATDSIHTNGPMSINLILCPSQFIFALSCRQRSFLQVLQFTERLPGYF